LQSSRCFWGNALFFVAATLLFWFLWKRKIRKSAQTNGDRSRGTNLYLIRPKGSGMANWVLIAGYVALVSWMMFASFSVKDGKLHISNPEYSDFGPNTAIMQSFGVDHNFPTEYSRKRICSISSFADYEARREMV
jgi:hypothetical protein